VKINLNQILPEGLVLEEELQPQVLQLEIEGLDFKTPVKVRAEISRATNAVLAKLTLETKILAACSRCLSACEIIFEKNCQLDYLINKGDRVIDFDPDIRQEIILDYPVKPLCSRNCKGLCPKCGKNLNAGKCNC
jgi:uncharacterized protein